MRIAVISPTKSMQRLCRLWMERRLPSAQIELLDPHDLASNTNLERFTGILVDARCTEAAPWRWAQGRCLAMTPIAVFFFDSDKELPAWSHIRLEPDAHLTMRLDRFAREVAQCASSPLNRLRLTL